MHLLVRFAILAAAFSIIRSSTAQDLRVPRAELFAPGVISGPGNDGAPTFSPDGHTLLFTRSAAHWTAILESHLVDGAWTKPELASFSGEWPDSSPAWSPDGSYVVFQSTRPTTPLKVVPKPGEPIPGIASNLWKVRRLESGWSAPERLPDTVNVTSSIWKPSIAASGSIYYTVIDPKGDKSLYCSGFKDGKYQQGALLPFSSGAQLDVDPEIAPDESLLVFSSAGRVQGDTHERLFLVRRKGGAWSDPVLIRYQDDVSRYGASTDNEPRLGSDGKTLYFASDRTMIAHFPRSREHAQEDLKRLDEWDNSNTNVWFFSLESYLR